MSRSSRPRTSRVLLALGAVVVVVALGVVAALTMSSGDGGSDTSTTPSPSDRGTSLGDVVTTDVAVARESFCDAVDAASVLRAVGASSEEQRVRTETWENGQQARLEPGLRDVSHEYGCSWRTPTGATARAWVFAPPVTREEARELADTTAQARGCSTVDGAPSFGASSVTTDCESDGVASRTYAGLFGDAWLTCQLAEPDAEGDAAALAARASVWCPAVLAAATG